MDPKTGYIEVDLFPSEVDDPDHPDVVSFREVLEAVAREYRCSLVSFEVEEGTVTFSFDSHELMADILKILQYEPKDSA